MIGLIIGAVAGGIILAAHVLARIVLGPYRSITYEVGKKWGFLHAWAEVDFDMIRVGACAEYLNGGDGYHEADVRIDLGAFHAQVSLARCPFDIDAAVARLGGEDEEEEPCA